MFFCYCGDKHSKQCGMLIHQRGATRLHVETVDFVVEIGRWSTIPISRYSATMPTFALTVQLKTRHGLCWSGLCVAPLEVSFHRYMRMQFQGASSLSFVFWVILGLAVVSIVINILNLLISWGYFNVISTSSIIVLNYKHFYKLTRLNFGHSKEGAQVT